MSKNTTIRKNVIIFFLIGVIIILGSVLVFSNIQNNPSNAIQNKPSSTTQNNSGPQPGILGNGKLKCT